MENEAKNHNQRKEYLDRRSKTHDFPEGKREKGTPNRVSGVLENLKWFRWNKRQRQILMETLESDLMITYKSVLFDDTDRSTHSWF